MKASIDAILHREQAHYLDSLHHAGDALIQEMEQYAAEHRVPIADREVATFLEITARSINARHVLEIGMAIGYSVVHLVRGMGPVGVVVTIEPNDEMIRASEGFLKKAGLLQQVRIERGKALDIMPHLNEAFDLVFIDAVKEEYREYLELALPHLRQNGVIIVDNLLWGGQVAGEVRSADQEESTRALRNFNRHFVNHPQLLAQVLSIGDGLGYAVKIS
jgi:predicted O-methyltransferase YrrM